MVSVEGIKGGKRRKERKDGEKKKGKVSRPVRENATIFRLLR